MSPRASTSALPPVASFESDRISAYYSLAFPNFTYYLQTLTVTIGRRPIPTPNPTSAAASGSGSGHAPSESALVDVDLGPLKSVSRLHARIEYEEEEERFILVVLGRNGAWVDGIWAGCGSKVPLGARSQIQIATRTFHFILPPPQEPDTTSPSPPPSTARQRSPSLDITSLSPASSRLTSPPPASQSAAAAPVVPLTASGSSSKPAGAKFPKKRKRPDPNPNLPLPEDMPPKPLATYAVMCYRAITSLGGKATLQDVIQWMIDNYEWYKLNVGGPWENSIRHNLSSNRAFRNVARSSDEKGKGFLWGIDPKSEKGLQDQDAKSRQAELDRQQGHNNIPTTVPPVILVPKVPPPPVKPVFTTEPLNKSVNAVDRKPVISKMSKAPPQPVNGQLTNHTVTTSSVPSALTASSPLSDTPATISAPSPSLPTSTSTSTTPSSGFPQLPSNVTLPIIVAPLPDSHPASSASAAAVTSTSPASALLTAPPIVLHSGTLILNPTIFAHLTQERLKELEGLGAQKALEILQGHLVQFLKEKMRAEGGGRGRGKGRGKRRKVGGRMEGEARSDGAGTDSGQRGTKREEREGAERAASTAEGGKSSVQSLSHNLANEQPHTNGVEERAVKKRKLDTDVDVDVDVIGP